MATTKVLGSMEHAMRRASLGLLALLLVHVGPSPVSSATTITYTQDAARLAALWVNTTAFEILGGTKAPKLNGSSVSAGIITWDAADNHHMRNRGSTDTVVLSTGDVKWAISKVKYNGAEPTPTYPSIVNPSIAGSRDAVVLDFWVRAKVGPPNVQSAIVGSFEAATNEGSPAAITRHGGGTAGLPAGQVEQRDIFQLEIDGTLYENKSLQNIWLNRAACAENCVPPSPTTKMHWYQNGPVTRESEAPLFVVGKEYRIKLRLADTFDRKVDSALYLTRAGLSPMKLTFA